MQYRNFVPPPPPPPRKFPFVMQEAVTMELQRLENEDIITPIAYSDWASPVVIVPKPDGHIRILLTTLSKRNNTRCPIQTNCSKKCTGVKPFRNCTGVKPFRNCTGVKPFRNCTGVKPFRNCTGVKPFRNCTGVKPFRNCTGVKPFRNCTGVKPFRNWTYKLLILSGIGRIE